MPRVQHQTRREGRISVGGTIYDIDSEGCVDASAEDAEGLLRGKKWRLEGEWKAWEFAVSATAPPVVAGARRARTRDELLGLAEAEGIGGASEALEKAHEAPADFTRTVGLNAGELGQEGLNDAPVEVEEVEEIVVSMDMTKTALVYVAEQLELDCSGMTKAQIIEAIEAASEE
jgi:hypothetical protein